MDPGGRDKVRKGPPPPVSVCPETSILHNCFIPLLSKRPKYNPSECFVCYTVTFIWSRPRNESLVAGQEMASVCCKPREVWKRAEGRWVRADSCMLSGWELTPTRM